MGAKRRRFKFVAALALSLSSSPIKAQPVITTEPSSQAVWTETNVTFTVTATGAGPLAYHRQFNGTNLPAVISTIAGPGITGSLGDGGMATNADLESPQAIALDGFGNLYIADTSNFRIRKVDAAGSSPPWPACR